MPSIATLENISNALDTAAKFVRLIGNEGITMEQFRLPIDDQAARRNLAAFFRNGCQLVVKGPSAVVIDRTNLPSPAEFIGQGWSVWKGPEDGDGLEGEPEEDPRSLVLAEIDFTKAKFEHCLADGEEYITGEEKLARMKAAPDIRPDFGVGMALFQEKGQATLRFLHDVRGISWFELAGTVLRDSDGGRYFLCLCREDDGSWFWDCGWLGSKRDRGSISPLLAS